MKAIAITAVLLVALGACDKPGSGAVAEEGGRDRVAENATPPGNMAAGGTPGIVERQDRGTLIAITPSLVDQRGMEFAGGFRGYYAMSDGSVRVCQWQNNGAPLGCSAYQAQ